MWKKIQNLWHMIVDDTKNEIVTYAAPAVQYISQFGGAALLALGETTLAGFTAGESWSVIEAAFITEAAKTGVTLAEGAASAVLNFAKANVLAKAAGADVAAADAAVAATQPPAA